MVDDKLNRRDYDDEDLVYQLECLHNYLNDPTVWVTGDMVDDEGCDYDNTYPSESDYPSDIES